MSMKSSFARQFGYPRGLVGRFVGKAMANGNAGFNGWVVDTLCTELEPRRILEFGFGPGVATARLLAAFPTAELFGVDHSATMLAAATSRNRAAIAAGRLRLVRSEASAVSTCAPLDLIWPFRSSTSGRTQPRSWSSCERRLRPAGSSGSACCSRAICRRAPARTFGRSAAGYPRPRARSAGSADVRLYGCQVLN
jgi:Methyltransferase domain